MVLRAALAALAIFVASGCGYRLAHSPGPDVPVRVSTLTNDTLEPGVELMLASALRREIDRTGGLRLVERATTSGYQVGGRVLRVETVSRTFTPGVRALEYTVTVQLELRVTGPGGRRVAIDPFAQRASEIYLASTDVQISRKNRDEALRRVAALLADRIRLEIERLDGGEGTHAGARRQGEREA